MWDLVKKLGMLMSNIPPNSEDLITEISYEFFEKFKERMNGIMHLGFDLDLDEVISLFGCCILTLNHPQSRADFTLDRCNTLITMLTQIISYITSNSNSKPSFALALLEVFIKECVRNRDLRHCVALPEGNIHVINELISTHFLLSYPNQNSHQNFIKSLSWSLDHTTFNDNKLGLDVLFPLLSSKSPFQIPYLIKAHFAIIGSDCFETRDPLCLISDETLLLDRAIVAFDYSVNLYFQCLCGLNSGDNPFRFKPDLMHDKLDGNLGTHKKIDCCMDDIISYCKEMLQSDFLFSLFSYIEESKSCVVHQDFRQPIGFIVKRILMSSLLRDNSNNVGSECKISQEVVCLAASLKLMASSLLQIIHHFRSNKEESKYKLVLDIIHCFTDYEANLIAREVLVDVMGKGYVRGGKSFAVLDHLINILMYSLDGRIGFLSKGCVFMMMAVLDLIIFEEGSLDSVTGLFADAKRFNAPDVDINNNNEEIINLEEQGSAKNQGTPKGSMDRRRSSIRIAREIQKVKKRLLLSPNTGSDEVDQSEGDKCDGRAYLKDLPECKRNPSEWEDLVDFIECEPDRDYLAYENNRCKFRQWLNTKRAHQIPFRAQWI